MKIKITMHAEERLLQRHLPDPRDVELSNLTAKAKRYLKKNMSPTHYRNTVKDGEVKCLTRGEFTAVYIFRHLSETTKLLVTAYWLGESR